MRQATWTIAVRFVALLWGTLVALTPIHAAVPSYGTPLIYARTGLSSFNLPNGSSLSSPTLSINDARNVALDVNFVGDTGMPGLFYASLDGTSTNGGIVAGANDTISGDPQLNSHGDVIYTIGFDDDPFVYDASAQVSDAINYPLGISGSNNLVLTSTDQLGGRLDVGFSGDVFGLFAKQSAGLPALTLYAADNGVDASSPYSFLYTPDTSDRGGPIGGPAGSPRIAAKVSTSSGFDFEEIHIFDADGTTRPVAVETETDPLSDYSEFITNSVAISDNGRMVAFQAVDLDGNSGIYRYDDTSGTIDQIAEVGAHHVATIDIFGPDVNDHGLVVFRGDDTMGRSSVFVGDGVDLFRVGGEGDVLATDLGERQLGRRDMDFSQSGAPRINNRGDVGLIFQYFDPTNPGSVADGSLVLLAPAFRSGDFDDDGSFTCDDIDSLIAAIAAGNGDLTFDLDLDGDLDLADRDIWLAQAGADQLPSGEPYLLGDANLDGIVNGADFDTWNTHKFSQTGAWCSADFNADGQTNGRDFLIWNAHKFTSADGSSSVTVPEPATNVTCLIALVSAFIGSAIRRSRGTLV